MIIYLGYFILNEKHKDGGSPSSVTAYYNSIIQHIKKFIENNRPDVIVNAAARVGGILANDTLRSEFILDNLG